MLLEKLEQDFRGRQIGDRLALKVCRAFLEPGFRAPRAQGREEQRARVSPDGGVEFGRFNNFLVLQPLQGGHVFARAFLFATLPVRRGEVAFGHQKFLELLLDQVGCRVDQATPAEAKQTADFTVADRQDAAAAPADVFGEHALDGALCRGLLAHREVLGS